MRGFSVWCCLAPVTGRGREEGSLSWWGAEWMQVPDPAEGPLRGRGPGLGQRFFWMQRPGRREARLLPGRGELAKASGRDKAGSALRR